MFNGRRAGWAVRVALRCLAVCVALSAAAGPARAADEVRSVSDYHHAVWTAKDGAPRDTWAIAQTTDGWLWFAGPGGLYRFDGVAFERRVLDAEDAARPRAVSSMLALRDGRLLLGFLNGGLGVLQLGRFTLFDDDQTRIAGTVQGLAEDKEGKLWAATRAGLLKFNGTSWQAIGSQFGNAPVNARNVVVDGDGTLWVAMPDEVLRLEHGAQRFGTGIPMAGVVELLLAPDGQVWAATFEGLRPLPGQHPRHGRAPDVNSRMSYAGLLDDEGWHWIWWLPPAATKTARTVRGIDTLGTIKTVLQDREGNLWFGDQQAIIHRLTRHMVAHVDGLPQMTGTVPDVGFAADVSGAIWMAVYEPHGHAEYGGLWKFDGTLRRMQADDIDMASAIGQAKDGGLWLVGKRNLWRKPAGSDRFVPEVDLPWEARGRRVHGLAIDHAGGIWTAIEGMGLFKHDGKAWERNGNLDVLPKEPPNVQICDRDGRLWFGYASGVVARVTGREVAVFNAKLGLDGGAIRSISVGRHILVGTEQGLFVQQSIRFVALKATDPGTFDAISGIVQEANGDVWLNTAHGAVKLRATDLDQAERSPPLPVLVEVYDEGDGFPGAVRAYAMSPNIVQAQDGRVWFAGVTSIGVIDPSKVRRSKSTPNPLIVSLAQDEQQLDPKPLVTLAAGTQSLRVTYTALSYTRPERIRFRYRLEGVEKNWIDAGTRRQAAYANLGPGRFRFLVEASDGQAPWTGAANSIVIEIPPTFVQSRLFLMLCLLVAAGVTAAAYRLRIAQLTARERGRAQERLRERERVARELHDTLLQAVQGLILKLAPVSSDATVPVPARDKLNEAISVAERLVTEGRDQIQGLRSDAAFRGDLAALLALVHTESDVSTGAKFSVIAQGAPRPLKPEAQDVGYKVAREAILNAFRHSHARSIEVLIVYSDSDLRVQVRDDGRGMDPQRAGPESARHWGMRGMVERAESIGGALEVWTHRGAGTEVLFVLGAARAYADAPLGALWSTWVRRLTGKAGTS